MRTGPALRAALRSPLPSGDELLFLRACLPSGEPGREAFERWQRRFADPVSGLRDHAPGRGRLLPLLQAALRHNGASGNPQLISALRASRAHEELRAQAMRRACRDALAALAAHGIDVIVVGGIALTETVYGEWGLRHSHDIDLVVDEVDLDQAPAILGAHAEDRRGDVTLTLPSGVLVTLHGCLYRDPYYAAADSQQRGRAIRARVARAEAAVLDPIDMLLHLCGHSACAGSASPQWAIDAWHLIERNPQLDWASLLERVRDGGLALSALTRLTWLAQALGASVPRACLAELGHAAEASHPLAAEVLLHQSRRDAGSLGLLKNVGALRAGPIVGRLLFPSADYLRLRAAPAPARNAAVLRAERAVRYSASVLRSWRASPGP